VKRRVELANASIAVLGADLEFADGICTHLASLGARLWLSGQSEEHLAELDVRLSQSELHRTLPSTEPGAVAEWLAREAGAVDGVVAVSREEFGEPACRSLLEPIASTFGARTTSIPAVLVHVLRPGAAAPAQTAHLPDLHVGPLRVTRLHARNVVSPALMSELAERARASSLPVEVLLAELFAGQLPDPLFTSRDLGPLVETLLGAFSLRAAQRDYFFDGAAMPGVVANSCSR
jgi:hypothetical protein